MLTEQPLYLPAHLLGSAHEPVGENGQLNGVQLSANPVRLVLSYLYPDVTILSHSGSAARLNKDGTADTQA